ncbi:MAG: 50S ribosome-binding GTPase, partial [Rhodobacteraceae bacterium]|nr:50S ribosome-binding GTPase [Paracoccaceae bacterium]
IPGLIEGAHEGAGLGDRFLGHVERCAVLLHLVDSTQEDVAEAYKVVRRELKAYGAGLDKKKEIVALNKCDALDPETRSAQQEKLSKACRKKVHLLSGVSGEGRDQVVQLLAKAVVAAREQSDQEEEFEAADGAWMP